MSVFYCFRARTTLRCVNDSAQRPLPLAALELPALYSTAFYDGQRALQHKNDNKKLFCRHSRPTCEHVNVYIRERVNA